jgi:hypothetical protein
MQIAGIAVTLGIAIVGGTFTGTAADIINGIIDQGGGGGSPALCSLWSQLRIFLRGAACKAMLAMVKW